ncbi:MAG: hypothetical protein Q7S66_05615 [bacterium]|nr:hypothetical protein [bacterium]
MYFLDFMEPALSQTKENFRLDIWVFELTRSQVKAMRAAITDPELKGFVTDADKPAKTVSLCLRQMAKSLMQDYELVNVIQVPEEMPPHVPTTAEMLTEDCDAPDCPFHNPGNPHLKNPWG